MIVRRGDATGSQALDYDAENRLVRFSQAGAVIVEYGYAADGTRLWKRKNQDPNKLQVWIGNIYEEKEQDGTRKTLFHVFAGGQRICTFEPTSVLNGGPNPSSTHVGYYYHQDHLGSSSALSGNTGSQLEVNVHYPFGRTQTAPVHRTGKGRGNRVVLLRGAVLRSGTGPVHPGRYDHPRPRQSAEL
jgi:YD repeat-containing protein